MNPVRQQIVDEALTWQNTRYHDHAGIKGVGVDCAYLPLRVYQHVGLIPHDFIVPHYSPQQWLKYKDDQNQLYEDTTYKDIVMMWVKREIDESEVQPGDFVLYKILRSWTHGAIVIDWPSFVLHPIAGRGVMGSHVDEGFLYRRPRRIFTLLDD